MVSAMLDPTFFFSVSFCAMMVSAMVSFLLLVSLADPGIIVFVALIKSIALL